MNDFDTGTPVSFLNRVEKLRNKIKTRTAELNIAPDHDENGHFYKFNGNRYPSVTGRLQILKDPSLQNWKMNKALEYVYTALSSPQQPPLEQIIQEAKLVPQQEFEGAGDIGKQVHAWRESLFQRWIIEGINNSKIPPILDTNPQVVSGIRAIIKFLVDTHYTPLACELYLADEKLGIGGTADDIGILDGKVGFMDLKSANIGDKDSYFYQVALYVKMFEKLYGIRTMWHKILHVSKTDGTYKLIDIPDIRKRIEEAKKIIKVSTFLENLREEKKKKAIII
jgi:hypothetical protein